jgi:hypothetical protein
VVGVLGLGSTPTSSSPGQSYPDVCVWRWLVAGLALFIGRMSNLAVAVAPCSPLNPPAAACVCLCCCTLCCCCFHPAGMAT